MPRFRHLAAACAAALSAAVLGACSPALNWRSVALPGAGLQATFPCKPEHASRSVELAGRPVMLAMAGCEAQGITFAVSHAALADPAQLPVALAHWRAAVLANLGPGAAAGASDVPFVPRGALALAQSVRTTAQGRRADAPVHMQAAWFARADGPQLRLYHAVAYSRAPLSPEAAEPFFAGVTLP